RRVQKLCEESRIPGVSKLGYMWLIPKNAEKPVDGRTKRRKEVQYE
ncbi:TPA: DNA-binding protein, partial [Clostridioides difficile]|nr:DNA-binding protein [Clostridioides difficile]